MRIFLDANILFSAAKSDGAIRELLRRLVVAGHHLCVDAYVVAEAARNLEQKGEAALDSFEALLGTMEVAAFQGGALSSEIAELLPEKDRPVLAAAVRLGCDALVTGDRTHFGALYGRIIEGVTVYSPRQLADSVLG